MKIISFTHEHLPEAETLSLACYEEERGHVPNLPRINAVPGLSEFADNKMGVAAFDNGKLVGFLCGYGPFDDAFGIPNIRGVFSPMGGNAAIPENRAEIYAALYQAAGEKWVRAGAVSHAVCLYAHDEAAQRQFFTYGFGLRCVDAVRGMDETEVPACDGYTFSVLKPDEIMEVLPLEHKHMAGYLDSPYFMYREKENEADFIKNFNHQSVYMAARHNGRMVAYMTAGQGGETFIQNTPGYIHIKGAYCLPEHRRKGISQQLLNRLTQTLKAQHYTRLGVDFESLNPSGSGFWLKHFTAYSHSVVRRIDENVLGKQ